MSDSTLYTEDNIQNTAESILAITEMLEKEVVKLIDFVDEDDECVQRYDQETTLGLLMALKQLARPLI